ncbi:hypothetical protein [Lysinibacillus sp. RC79]|uniref:hypothetical protein n=1 Tax=Lysinibacillus sp. RC79 TaxID=3156296 RepID=UPI003517FE68
MLLRYAKVQYLTFFSKCFGSESEASATSVLVAKAKRQLQKSLTSIGGEMNAVLSHFSAGVQTSAEIEELSLKTERRIEKAK